METITFDGVQGMDPYQARRVIRMKLAARGFYDVEFTEVPYKKGSKTERGGLNHVILYVDEKFHEVARCPVFRGRDWMM